MKNKREEIRKILQEFKFLQEQIEAVENNNYRLKLEFPLYNMSGSLKTVVHIEVDNRGFYIGGLDMTKALQLEEAVDVLNNRLDVDDLPVVRTQISDLEREVANLYRDYSLYFENLYLNRLVEEQAKEIDWLRSELNKLREALGSDIPQCYNEDEEDWEDDDY